MKTAPRKFKWAHERVGEKYGCWTIVRVGRYVGTCRQFVCKCECGTAQTIPCSNLYSGKSTKCQRCAADAKRHTSDERKAMARANGQRCNKDGRVVCLECGVTLCGAAVYNKILRCQECAAVVRGEKRRDVPLKHAISIGTIARACGISRQAVHFYVGRFGWDEMLRYYKEKYGYQPKVGAT